MIAAGGSPGAAARGYYRYTKSNDALKAGYADSLHTLYPILSETSGSFSTETPGQRVDYIFTFGIEGAASLARPAN